MADNVNDDDNQVETSSIPESGAADYAEMLESDDFIGRALKHQGNIFQPARDIRASLKGKLKEELTQMMRVFIEQSNKIAELEGQLKTTEQMAEKQMMMTEKQMAERPQMSYAEETTTKPREEPEPSKVQDHARRNYTAEDPTVQ